MIMKKNLIMVFSLCLIFSADILQELPPDNYESWKQLKKSKIRVQYSEDFSIPWCRASANFRFSQNEIYSALKNLKNYKNIFERVSESRLIDKNIVYIRLDMPYIFADRDYTVEYVESLDGDQIIFQFYSVVHPNSPDNSGSVTLPRAAGEWKLIPISENSTRVIYTWNGELLGNFPSSSLQTAWKKQGTEVLSWLNEYLKSKKEN